MIHILIPNKDKKDINVVIERFVQLNKVFNFKSINVVDFGSSDIDILISKDHGVQINFILAKHTFFNKSKALNFGLYFLKKHLNDSLLICDADVLFDESGICSLLESDLIILDEVVESADKLSSRKAFGIIKCKISYLIEVNGYDSEFEGWGFEDHDIINRLSCLYITKRRGKAMHLSHGDEERTRNYKIDNLGLMRNNNFNRLQNKASKPDAGTLLIDNYNKKTKTINNPFNKIIWYE